MEFLSLRSFAPRALPKRSTDSASRSAAEDVPSKRCTDTWPLTSLRRPRVMVLSAHRPKPGQEFARGRSHVSLDPLVQLDNYSYAVDRVRTRAVALLGSLVLFDTTERRLRPTNKDGGGTNVRIRVEVRFNDEMDGAENTDRNVTPAVRNCPDPVADRVNHPPSLAVAGHRQRLFTIVI